MPLSDTILYIAFSVFVFIGAAVLAEGRSKLRQYRYVRENGRLYDAVALPTFFCSTSSMQLADITEPQFELTMGGQKIQVTTFDFVKRSLSRAGGAAVRVYYHPKYPAFAALENGSPAMIYSQYIVLGIVFFASGAAGLALKIIGQLL